MIKKYPKHILLAIFFASLLILASNINLLNNCFNKNDFDHKKKLIHNTSIIFNITNLMPESLSQSVLTPMCIFEGNYTFHDCKTYTNLFLDLDCVLYQEKSIFDHNGNPGYYLYMSPEFSYYYDARLDIYNRTSYSFIRLAPGLTCQSNNICVFIVNFIFSYKDWNKVPYTGNNVTLNCSKFDVYAYI